MKKQYNPLILLLITLISITSIGGFIAYKTSFNDTEYTVTVTDKERIVEGVGKNTNSKYLVFCEDESGQEIVFENTDALLRGKFNSSDIQAKLKEGNTYKLAVVGYRIPFLSMYQNIIKVE